LGLIYMRLFLIYYIVPFGNMANPAYYVANPDERKGSKAKAAQNSYNQQTKQTPQDHKEPKLTQHIQAHHKQRGTPSVHN